MFRYLLTVALVACLILQASALPKITVKGAKFFAGGKQYFLKGVAYQGTPNDPLIDTTQCQLDATLMQSIGTNSIRVYHVDPRANHDGCMKVFDDAGIHVWLDLDDFDTSIVQATPAWTSKMLSAYASVMDEFQKYDNLGGFWIGNEVINNLGGSPAAPFIKAAVADMKAYMSAKGYRAIPIGYAAADIAELRPMLQNYLACGEPEQAIDFFGLNSYEWCGAATYEQSGYGGLQAMAEGYNLPIFFSETGCNVGGERTFNDQKAIFGEKMIDTWSGSIIYEWVQETNDYGIVDYPNGQIYSGAPIKIQPDFNNLANVWKDINPVGVSEGSYTPTFNPPTCPTAAGGWTVNGDVPLPRLDPSIIKSVVAGAEYFSYTLNGSPQPTGMPTISSTSSRTSTSEIPALVSVAATLSKSESSTLVSTSSISSSTLPSSTPHLSSMSTRILVSRESTNPANPTTTPALSSIAISKTDAGTTTTVLVVSEARVELAFPSEPPFTTCTLNEQDKSIVVESPDYTWSLTLDHIETVVPSSTQPTCTATAANGKCSSAASALRANGFGEWIKHASTLGGKGGLVGLFLGSILVIAVVGAFLS